MQPMQLPVEAQARVALVHSPAEAARVPEDLEPVLAPGAASASRTWSRRSCC